MRNVSLLVFLTQLGLSVALPLAGFIALAVWLRNAFDWGSWVIWTGIILGLFSAVQGFLSTLKAMQRLSEGKKESKPKEISFNDHD
ncbi:MAG: AtpZ/AtpI family protein [Oscillospiraceae bacterium]|nr:AtpZ/AtpI family protein [Oscillospiraceae bacterium]